MMFLDNLRPGFSEFAIYFVWCHYLFINSVTNVQIQYEAELQEFLKVTGMHASDVAKLRPASSKKTSSRDRARSHSNVVSSSPQSTLLPAGNQESVAVSSVLPHIAQIWPPCNSSVQPASLQNGSDAGEMHGNASLVNRFVLAYLMKNKKIHHEMRIPERDMT